MIFKNVLENYRKGQGEFDCFFRSIFVSQLTFLQIGYQLTIYQSPVMAGTVFSPYIPAIQTLLAGMTGITGFPASAFCLLLDG